MGESKRRRALGLEKPDLGYCPATMCPLFAPDGSPWTGDKDSPCDGKACRWFQRGGCTGRDAAQQQVLEAAAGYAPLQLGPVRAVRERVPPKTFDCPRAAACRWQREAGAALCPPRDALARGADPRSCAW